MPFSWLNNLHHKLIHEGRESKVNLPLIHWEAAQTIQYITGICWTFSLSSGIHIMHQDKDRTGIYPLILIRHWYTSAYRASLQRQGEGIYLIILWLEFSYSHIMHWYWKQRQSTGIYLTIFCLELHLYHASLHRDRTARDIYLKWTFFDCSCIGLDSDHAVIQRDKTLGSIWTFLCGFCIIRFNLYISVLLCCL